MRLVHAPLTVLLLVAGGAGALAAVPEEVVVTAARAERNALDVIGNTARLGRERIALTSHQHVHELGNQVAGTWISRGSGQEHLTAIRSPVLTGPGACGAFLMLEDGIPIRPTGFCNVNQLFETLTEQSAAAEVLRGPANALYGSNGLHGTLNFLLPAPGSRPGWAGSVEAGPDDFWRGRAAWDGRAGDTALAAGLLLDDYGGFRDDSGYDQQKGYLRGDRRLAGGMLRMGLTATRLDQDTAGFLTGEDAYKDSALRTTNANPEAFRKADSQRGYARWIADESHPWAGADLRAWVRRSDMEFLQHFLPGKPLEENGQVSAGFTASLQRRTGSRANWSIGVDAEYADGFLKERQDIDLGPDSSRPTGRHYDFDVSSLLAAPFAQLDFALAPAWTLQAGLRLEYLRYDYDNKMLSGDTRDDGTPCAGGCLFFRPADRTDDFLELAPNLGVLFRPSPDHALFLALTRGFRAPQATELYRLQSGQAVADLNPETMDSIEAGWRWQPGPWRLEAVAFAMRKRDYIFRDADGFNVSDGKSDHIGVEMQAGAAWGGGFYAELAATWARHTYAFDRVAAQGETIASGDDVDTAPRTLGSLRLGVDRSTWLAEVEWVHQGRYYLDAGNTATYPGHDLLNMRGVLRLGPDWSVALRLNNLLDELYADRADFAFGSYRYFPGRTREVFVQVAFRTL